MKWKKPYGQGEARFPSIEKGRFFQTIMTISSYPEQISFVLFHKVTFQAIRRRPPSS